MIEWVEDVKIWSRILSVKNISKIKFNFGFGIGVIFNYIYIYIYNCASLWNISLRSLVQPSRPVQLFCLFLYRIHPNNDDYKCKKDGNYTGNYSLANNTTSTYRADRWKLHFAVRDSYIMGTSSFIFKRAYTALATPPPSYLRPCKLLLPVGGNKTL